MVNDIQKEITNGIDTSTIDKGDDILIEEKDVTVTITKNSNQKNEINTKSNKTSIDLGDCEVKLKERYNIPKNESLYILKMDVKQEGYNIPKIQYEVYYPLKNDSKLYLLNLSICKDINIDIYLPISLNGSLDKIDPNSNFYTDICTTYTSENGTDLTLAERKKNYINNNLTVCEENCDFIGYNETTEKAICSCKVKTNFISKISENILNKEELYKSFTNFKNIFNIKVIKCIHLIFSVKAFKENYANIILISIILLFIFCLIIFACKYYEKGIKFYVDIIIYFTLFYENVSNTIKKQKKKGETNNSNFFILNNNITNTDISKNNTIKGRNKTKKSKKKKTKALIETHEFGIELDKKNDLLKNDKQWNQNKKKENQI